MVAFLVSPNGFFVAYVADQDTDGVFELYTVVVDKTAGDTAVKVSRPMAGSGVLRQPSGEYSFGWAPDSSRIAYLADQINDEGIELYTASPNVSGSFFKNSTGKGDRSNVTGFEWAPNSLRIAFIANKVDPRFALYTTGSDDSLNVLVSSILLADSEVLSFGWAPDGSRIAYIADEISINVLELFTTRPVAPLITKISGNLVAGGDVLGFQWAPNSSRVAYTADQDENDIFELYSSTPDLQMIAGFTIISRCQHIRKADIAHGH